MAPGVVVGGILLPTHQLLGVEQLPVGPGADLINHCRLQINEDGPDKNINIHINDTGNLESIN